MADAGRVIGGSARGARLAAPGEGTRPFGDRVKESLFGVLEADPAEPLGGVFLDLYAGSGAAGIEALSRGAPRALFVERDAGAARVIRANLARAELEGGHVVRAEVLAWLAGIPALILSYIAAIQYIPIGRRALAGGSVGSLPVVISR